MSGLVKVQPELKCTNQRFNKCNGFHNKMQPPQRRRGSAPTRRMEITEKVNPVDESKTLMFPVGVNQTIQGVSLNSHLHQNKQIYMVVFRPVT